MAQLRDGTNGDHQGARPSARCSGHLHQRQLPSFLMFPESLPCSPLDTSPRSPHPLPQYWTRAGIILRPKTSLGGLEGMWRWA